MRQKHKAGEKVFSDFAGSKFRIIDQTTGEVQYAHLFVCTLGASNYTFADVFRDESSESWCTGQARAFQFFQGVSEIIVPDNPRAAVTKPCRYEPELNEAFRSMAACVSSRQNVGLPILAKYAPLRRSLISLLIGCDVRDAAGLPCYLFVLRYVHAALFPYAELQAGGRG
jgi:transposase